MWMLLPILAHCIDSKLRVTGHTQKGDLRLKLRKDGKNRDIALRTGDLRLKLRNLQKAGTHQWWTRGRTKTTQFDIGSAGGSDIKMDKRRFHPTEVSRGQLSPPAEKLA